MFNLYLLLIPIEPHGELNFDNLFFVGECQNSSPADKRRTAASHADFLETVPKHSVNSQIQSSQFSTVTTLAILGCVIVVILFGVIFTALQVRTLIKHNSKFTLCTFYLYSIHSVLYKIYQVLW